MALSCRYGERFSAAGNSAYFAPLHVTLPTPPLEAVGVTYLSSSVVIVAISRFCSVPFQFGKVALSTLNVRDFSAEFTE
jgi:hypothetical protein